MKDFLIKLWKDRICNKYTLAAICILFFYINFKADMDNAVREYIKSEGFRLVLAGGASSFIGWLFYKKGKE